MDRHGVRYLFEHRLLPNYFFKYKAGFVGSLLDDKDFLFRLIDEVFTDEKLDNPYKEDDFSIVPSKVTDEVMMMKTIFPEPEEEPLCYCSYMFFDKKFEKISYFCIEKGNGANDNKPFVCSWAEDGGHYNHGNCTFGNHNDFLRCTEIHMKRFGYE